MHSCIEANAIHSNISVPPISDFSNNAAAQQRDTELQQLQSSSTFLKLQPVPLPTSSAVVDLEGVLWVLKHPPLKCISP